MAQLSDEELFAQVKRQRRVRQLVEQAEAEAKAKPRALLGNLHIPKEDQLVVLDPIPNPREIVEFEERLGKPKPLLGGAFSSFAGRKYLQHGAVEMHYCSMLKRKIACSACVYWLSAV